VGELPQLALLLAQGLEQTRIAERRGGLARERIRQRQIGRGAVGCEPGQDRAEEVVLEDQRQAEQARRRQPVRERMLPR